MLKANQPVQNQETFQPSPNIQNTPISIGVSSSSPALCTPDIRNGKRPKGSTSTSKCFTIKLDYCFD